MGYYNWKQANRRRIELIEKDIDGSITKLEQRELAALQALADFHISKHAPLPVVQLEEMERWLRARGLPIPENPTRAEKHNPAESEKPNVRR